MNRSILIVICDFLLVSLLAFSTVDINKVADSGMPTAIKMEMAPPPSDNGKDLAAVMRLALDEERRQREQLFGELTRANQELGGHERAVLQIQQQLQAREQEQLRLQQQYSAAQSNIERLNRQLQASSAETVLSQEKLALLEAETRKHSEQAAALQQQLAALAKSNQVVLSEKQQLSTQLQLAAVEKRAATEQVARMTDQVKAEREEKAKLAEGVKALATRSGQLAEEIRQNQPLAANTLFSQFLTNRVLARFSAVKSGLFGSNRRKETETILVTDGTNTFALCHVQDTPLTLGHPGIDWEGLTGDLSRSWATFPMRSMYFSLRDPRVVWMPISPAEAFQFGCKIYRTCPDPLKFQEAVIVGIQEPYYGECNFEIDLTAPEYLKLDRNALRGGSGKINPSRGDLVLSKNGELLGIMANDTYCLVIRDFDAAATFRLGEDVRTQHTGMILSGLYSQWVQLPSRLQ